MKSKYFMIAVILLIAVFTGCDENRDSTKKRANQDMLNEQNSRVMLT